MSIGVLILGFGISWLSVKLIWQHGATALLIDTPNERSSHTRPTPRGGGLGFVVAFFGAISSMIVLEALPQSKAPLLDLSLDLGIDESTLTKLLCLVPLAAIGFLDDRYSLPATVRYAVHLGVSIVAIAYFNAQAWLGLSTFSSTVMLGFLVVAMTALINFYNFMDGLDGLVASVTALQLSFLAVYLNQPIWWLLAAALLGFLYWNWAPAKIFMGDVGSTFLGACVAIALLSSPLPLTQTIAACCITAPLIGDALYTLSKRALKGENIFKAHRTHIYQRLQQSGWNHARVAKAYLGLTLVSAILIYALNLVGALITLMTVGVCLCAGEAYLQRSCNVTIR